MTPLPTDIAAIADLDDGSLRNLLITQRYCDVSQCLLETVGPGNVNWSTFATWASKTAGMSIRNEEVPALVANLAATHLFLLDPVRETLGLVSKSIAIGNRKVYAELAPLFVEFVRVFRDTPGAGGAELATFVGRLDGRDSKDGGQAPLITAFSSYFKARAAQDPVVKARHMLLGNCLIGLHEQTRLQPQIKEAMDAPIDAILRKHLRAGATGGFLTKILGAIERPLSELTDVAQIVWEAIATRTLMSLALPGGAVLPLGKDIPRASAARAYLPAALTDVADPAELAAVMKLYDRALGDTDEGSGSVDWRVLEDRMNFIVNLFRSRQQDLDLLGPPFSAPQRAMIEARRMPGPELGRL